MSSRKEMAATFLRMASSGDVRSAYDRFVASSFRHHNPYFRGDAASLAAGMEQNAKQNPSKTMEILRAIEDDDLVAVHSRVRLKPEGPDVALAHIFRFEGDRIAELWDIGQPVPPDGVNANGMF